MSTKTKNMQMFELIGGPADGLFSDFLGDWLTILGPDASTGQTFFKQHWYEYDQTGKYVFRTTELMQRESQE